jgi:hypothetical protein
MTGRFTEGEPPWDDLALAKEAVRRVSDILDVATGAGEFAPFPGRATAVAGYIPDALWPAGGLSRRVFPCSKATRASAKPTTPLPGAQRRMLAVSEAFFMRAPAPEA